LENDRVVFAEPIEIGERVRDIASSGDGDFVLYTDSDSIVRLTPLEGLDDGAAIFTARCGGCHHHRILRGIGPPLGGVVGRSVASLEDYHYSLSLQNIGGRWTREKLDAYLANPSAYAPGTTMYTEGITSAEARRGLIDYLSTL